MPDKKKKFVACLLRISDNEFIVAEWDQLITTANKSKLGVGSSVGYKRSTNKREKIIRGTIIAIGSLQVCEQQKKLFMSKVTKKKAEASNFDNDDEDESADVSDDQEEESDESDDECLQIDTDKEICDNNESDTAKAGELNTIDEGNKSQTNKSNKVVSNIEDKETSSSSCKRKNSDIDIESPSVPKRSIVSMARFDQLETENARLKKQVDKFNSEWMPRPTNPAVIQYFIHMGEILSSGGESEEKKEEKLLKVCTTLNMEEEQLNRLQKPNGTKTARSIVRACYPASVRINFDPEDLESDFRYAIHDYVQLFHGMEGLTEGKINESINNVFRSAKSQKKEKDIKQKSLPSSVNSGNKNKSKKTCASNDKENIRSSNK